jgi:DNA-binding Lrp family transcriptional regulator
MPRQQDTETGKFSEVYSDEKFLAVLDELGQAATSEIAETLGCSREHAYRRLRSLEDQGDIESRAVGRAKLWERTDGVNGVNPDDPFFSRETYSAGEPTDTSERVDEILYGSDPDSTVDR